MFNRFHRFHTTSLFGNLTACNTSNNEEFVLLPGGAMMQPSPTAAYTAVAAGGLYPYGAQMAHAQPHHPMIAAHPQATMAALPPQAMTHIQAAPRVSPYGHPYQPIMYWYPSPPVSPQSSYYVHTSPTTVAIKGLPFSATTPEILAFFDGIFEVSRRGCRYGDIDNSSGTIINSTQK